LTLIQDIRFGLRTLAGARGFTAVAVLSLALGIGVATSAFSELNGFVLRDVPGVARPDELVTVEPPTSYPNYQRYRERSDLFSATLAYAAPVPLGVFVGGRTERTWGHLVTASYFSTLGVRPSLGRLFGPEEDQPGRAPTVVVSYRYWQDHLSSDRSIVGKALRINGQPCTVIGVGPDGFQGASPLVYIADLWLPASVDASVAPELADHALDRHDAMIFHFEGRMQPGVTAARVEAELDAVARQLEQQYGDPDRQQKGRRVKALPGGKLVPVPKEDLPFLTGFFVVLGGIILLIACSNVANMTLARAAERRREIAIRLALGSGRFRLMRQLLTESMLVAAGAGVLGFLFASWIMRLASRESAWRAFAMPLTLHLEPDGRVLLFTLLLTAFTGLAFGLAPALQATRTDLTPALKEGGNVRLPRFRRLSVRNLLVMSQVAGSLALLLITGFLVIGHQRMTGLDVGFDAQRLYVISLDPVRDGYSPSQAADFFHKLLDRARRLPSVTAASLTDTVPMSMVGKPGAQFLVDGEGGAKVFHGGQRYVVGKDFFDTLGIPILAGRGFRQEDETNGSAAAIVSEKMARECWKGQDPLGKRIEIGSDDVPTFSFGGVGIKARARVAGMRRTLQVVGVARNIRIGLNTKPDDSPNVLYVPLDPAAYARPGLHGLTLLVRAAPGPRGENGIDALGAVRRDIAAMDEKLTPFNARSMPDQIDEMMFPVKVALYTYGFIGVFGLILAAVGLAGVTAYSVTQRRREIGIRVALGAQNRDVMGLVMKESAVMITIGTVIGLLGAQAGIRMLGAFLSIIARTAGTPMRDPFLLVGAPLLLALLGLLSCYVPARRSTRVDPVVTLRQE